MGRHSKIWERAGGRGFHTTIRGEVIFLGHNKREAERKFKALLADSTPRAHSRYSIQDLIVIYLKDARDRIKPVTFDHYQHYLEMWLAYVHRLKPDDLRAYHLREWLKSRKWNPSTRHTAGRIVKIWSKWCFSDGYTDAERLGAAKLPTPTTRDAADPQDLLKLEQAIGDESFKEFWQLLYDTGARPGELYGITASQISLKTSTAIVRGKTGDRVVGLTPRACEILRRAMLRWPEGPILRRGDGEPWRRRLADWQMEKWTKKAGSPNHLVMYSCRHDLYRRWTEAGVDELVLARQIGHFSRGKPHLRLLHSTYAHIEGAPLAAAAKIVEGQSGSRSSRRRG